MKSYSNFSKIIRAILPQKIRKFIANLIPKFYKVNTYVLRNPKVKNSTYPIADKYIIKEVTWKDVKKLKEAYYFRGATSYNKKVPSRLNAPEWVGLAVFDNTAGEIAYIAWVITSSIKYFEEFGIVLHPGQYLLKDGFCVPKYRHQGLHTRMEQERINYCVRNGAYEIFIQIHNSNKKGIASVDTNGYKLYQQNYVIQWPIFNIYRSVKAFLKNPFKRVIK